MVAILQRASPAKALAIGPRIFSLVWWTNWKSVLPWDATPLWSLLWWRWQQGGVKRYPLPDLILVQEHLPWPKPVGIRHSWRFCGLLFPIGGTSEHLRQWYRRRTLAIVSPNLCHISDPIILYILSIISNIIYKNSHLYNIKTITTVICDFYGLHPIFRFMKSPAPDSTHRKSSGWGVAGIVSQILGVQR